MEPWPGKMLRRSERGPDLLDFKALDAVTRLVAVKAVEADTALEAGAHLVGVVLEATQGAHLALEDRFLAAADACGGIAGDLALGDQAAGDKTLGDREDLAHLGPAELVFLEIGVEQVGHHL